MDLTSIITQVPNPSETSDVHAHHADSDEARSPNDPSFPKSDGTGASSGLREEETPFSDNNNAGDADGGATASVSVTSPPPVSDVSVQGAGTVMVPTTGSLQVSASPPVTSAQPQRPRRRSFFRSLLCCFAGSPAEGSGPPLEPETNGDLRDRTGVMEPLPIQPVDSHLVSKKPPLIRRENNTTSSANNHLNLISSVSRSESAAEKHSPRINIVKRYRTSIYRQSSSRLLGPPRITDREKKCFIIDLDETLVHSSFKPVDNPDFVVPVEIDGTTHQVYVLKRPYVDEFLKRMGQLYECVLFTASLAKYADPVANLLDKWNVFRFRLFREACVFHRGNYVKDLSRLGRDIHKVVILDNSPSSYMFHTENAVQVLSWFDDREDRALLDLIPFFEALARAENVITFLKHNQPPGMPAFASLGLGGQSLTEA